MTQDTPSMTQAGTVRPGTARPGGVTLVAIIGIVTGVLLVSAAVIALSSSPASGVAGVAVIILIFGAADVIVSIFLLRGSNLARVLLTISFGVSVISSAISVFLIQSANGTETGSAISSIVLALIGIALLWTARANKYFQNV